MQRVDHRNTILVEQYLGGLAAFPFIWFLGSLGSFLRTHGEPRLAAVAFGGGIVTAGLALAFAAIQATLAFDVAKQGDPAVVRALFDLNSLLPFPFVLAVLVGATSIAALRSKALPRWYGLVGALVALVDLVGGTTFARTGFWSPTGGFGFIFVFLVFLGWLLVTSGLLVIKIGAAE